MNGLLKLFRKLIGSPPPKSGGDPKLRLHKEEKTTRVDGSSTTPTAQMVYVGCPDEIVDLKWVDITLEKPRYYDQIHIWDGRTLHMDWCRVWSEELEQDVYVNRRDEEVVSKITHWAIPKGESYPKYEPMTSDDVLTYTRRDLLDIIDDINNDMVGVKAGVDPIARMTYNSALQECITIVKKKLNSNV